MLRERSVRAVVALFVLLMGAICVAGCRSSTPIARPEMVLQAPDETDGLVTSSDGRSAATWASAHQLVRVYDLGSGLQRLRISVPNFVETVALSSSTIAIATLGSCEIHDLADGRLLRRFALPQDDHVIGMAFQPNAPDTLAIANDSPFGVVDIFDADSGRQRHRLLADFGGPMSALAFAPDGTRLATMNKTSRIAVWKTKTWESPGVIQAHSGSSQQLAFGPTFETLVTAVADGPNAIIETWDLPGKRRSHEEWLDHLRPYAVAFSSDGRKIAVGAGSEIVVFDRDPWKLNTILYPHGAAEGVRFIDRDRTLVSSSEDGVSLISVASGAPLRAASRGETKHADELVDLTDVDVTADGRRMLLGTTGKDVLLLDLAEPSVVKRLPCPYPCAGMHISADGAFVASGSRPAHRVWSVADGRAFLLPNQLTTDGVYSATAFGPSHQFAAASADRVVTVWDFDRNTSAWFPPRDEKIELIAFVDATTVAVIDEGANVCLGDIRRSTWMSCRSFWGIHAMAASAGLVALAHGGELELFRITSASLTPIWRREVDELVSSLALDASHQRLFAGLRSGAKSRALTTYDLRTGKVLWREDAPVSDHGDLVAPTDGRDVLFIDSAASSVHVIDASSGAERISISVGADGILARTPSGYYTAPPALLSDIAFRVGSRAVPAPSLDAFYNRPDLVYAAIGRTSPARIATFERAHRARLERLGLKDIAADPATLRPPTVDLAELPVSVTTKMLSVRATATSEHPLRAMHFYVNGARVASKPVAGAKADAAATLELADGENTVEAIVVDERGVSSLPASAGIRYLGPPTPRKLFVATVGVGDYPDASRRLTTPEPDANEILAELSKTRPPFNSVVPLGGPPWTRTKVLDLKKQLAATHADDVVVMFVAGHGRIGDDTRYYFAPHDVAWKDIAHTGISFEDLDGILDAIPAQRKLLLLDTCHAGDQRSDDEIENILETFVDVRRTSGSTVITATRASEYAADGDAHSPFASALLEGLRGAADQNKSGDISLGELEQFLKVGVPAASKNRQHPSVRKAPDRIDFALH